MEPPEPYIAHPSVYQIFKAFEADQRLLAETMSAHPLLYNGTIMDVSRMKARQKKLREGQARAVRRRAFIRSLARRVSDKQVMVFACLDCGELHHLDHEFGRGFIEPITREGAESIKERYVEAVLATGTLRPEDVLFGNIVL